VLTNSLGEVVSRRDFLPFGEEVLPDGANRTANQKYVVDGVRQKFTGYQKDEETGLDFAEARMYNNQHARFTAIDPLLASGKSANPQTFNRYVYVTNNPLILTDPSGLQAAEVKADLYWDPNHPEKLRFNIGPKEGFVRYSGGPVESDRVDGNRYRFTARGYTIMGPSSDFMNTPSVRPPGDDFSPGTPEHVITNIQEYVMGAVHSGSKMLWDGASQVAPDYGKIGFRVPLVLDLEFSVDRYFRPYGGFGTPFGSYGNRTDFNLMDSSRPRSWGFKAPSIAFGWFVNRGNGRDEIGDGLSGANLNVQVPYGPVGVGVSKSLTSDSGGILSSPTAVEVGTPGGAFNIGGSEEIPCDFCARLRQSIPANFSPNRFRRQ